MAKRARRKVLPPVLLKNPDFSVQLFTQLWLENNAIAKIARRFKTSEETIRVAADILQLKQKCEIVKDTALECQPGDPTPEDIAAQTALMRQNWHDAEFRARANGMRAVDTAWRPPSYSFDASSASFNAATPGY